MVRLRYSLSVASESHAGVRHVHLFLGGTLLGTVSESNIAPQKQCNIGGVTYRCISYIEVTEQSGDRGFDMQVEPLNPQGAGEV